MFTAVTTIVITSSTMT